MSMPLRAKAVTSAISTIEGVSSRIEEIFAKAGDQLGRGHLIFQGLNQSLATLSEEFSGAQIEGTSQALHDIAGRLTGLAEALPAEGALLGDLGKAATEASELLKPLFKHIQMISIIARSAKIEAASLAQDREGDRDGAEPAQGFRAALPGPAVVRGARPDLGLYRHAGSTQQEHSSCSSRQLQHEEDC